jgi:hypothetical protein
MSSWRSSSWKFNPCPWILQGYQEGLRQVRHTTCAGRDHVWDGPNGKDACLGVGRWVHPIVPSLISGVVPDIQTVGKGLNGGYQALSAVLMQSHVVEGLRGGSGAFANGQTFQCHPAAAAAGVAVLSVFESDDIVATCAKRGNEVCDLRYGLRIC